MVPDIVVQKRNHQANSLDSSATPSPLTDSSLTNSPATPASFSPTPSPESQSSTASATLSNSPAAYRYYADNNNNSNNGLPATNGGGSISHRQSTRPGQNGQLNGYYRNNVVPKPNQSSFSDRALSQNGNQLPINSVKNQLIQKIKQDETIILIGETGCGKTTQIPQFIYEFYSNPQFYGLIGITQPRRVAAISIANRVAQEMRSQLGDLVGYTIRFEDHTSSSTRIKYMTDGILLREAISDPLLSKYRVIVLDEAHERTVHTDVLFGVVKKAQRLRRSPKRPLDASAETQARQLRPLKLIIMSATMDVDNFSRYFNHAPVYYIQGRTYPIEIFYTQEKQSDYVTTALITISQIHQQEDEIEEEPSSGLARSNVDKRRPIGGDIIVFCTGQEEIESMIKTVEDLTPQLNAFKTRSGITKTLKVYPLYAALPNSKQQSIFTRPRDDCFRRVIFSTNIAETSVTIPNIRFVIDTGKVKVRIFSAKTGFEVMHVEDISRAQAAQRSGRAGRLAPGQCYRLYTKKEFKKRTPFPVPDIQKCNLSNILLQMLAMGIKDVATFDFVDPPAKENIDASLESLLLMKAIEEVKEAKVPVAAVSLNLTEPNCESASTTISTHYKLTDIGRQMVTFPVDPRFSALIIASKAFRCTDEILIIISMLSIDSVFVTPSSQREQAQKMHKKFASSEGDFIKLLNVFRRYKEAKQSGSWCLENFLRPVQLKMAVEIRSQLVDLCAKVDIPIVSCNDTKQIRRCFAIGAGVGVGLGANVATIQRSNDYQLLDFHNRKITKPQAAQGPNGDTGDNSSRSVFIHPSSCLFANSSRPECVLFVELVHTSKSYMRNVCAIDQQWLIEYKDKKPEECARMMVASNLNTV